MSINIEHLLTHNGWLSKIDSGNFDDYALSIFHYQAKHNSIYADFIAAINRNPDKVKAVNDIPFLPIAFFKTHKVLTGNAVTPLMFESSGTTGTQNSRHYLADPELYRQSFLQTFHAFYGAPEDFIFLCLLPSYLERGNSSLVYMADALIKQSKSAESGFYLNDWERLAERLQALKGGAKKVMLLGVTFALLDFAEQYPMDLSDVVVMETGGMKGRREEWTRAQVQGYLQQQWQLNEVHSEYGMTELLSQAYSKGRGIFNCPAMMQVMVRDENDPFDLRKSGSGCLNVIDLANVHSCAFIATDDIARIAVDGSFEVLGRLDNSALRGCSLMVV